MTEEEEKQWHAMHPDDRPLDFVPRKFKSLRHVPLYADFIKERFNRCLDLCVPPHVVTPPPPASTHHHRDVAMQHALLLGRPLCCTVCGAWGEWAPVSAMGGVRFEVLPAVMFAQLGVLWVPLLCGAPPPLPHIPFAPSLPACAAYVGDQEVR